VSLRCDKVGSLFLWLVRALVCFLEIVHRHILFELRLARIFHELPSRDREDGRATWQPQGVGSEAYPNGTSQEPTSEDARKDGHIRSRSR
jgi:hypothetical protein